MKKTAYAIFAGICICGSLGFATLITIVAFQHPDAGQGRLLLMTWKEYLALIALFIAAQVLFHLFTEEKP